MIGIVIRENSVLVSRHFDAYTGSDPYFSARSAVVLPAGIAVRITAHPVMIGSAFNRRMIKSARNGSATRRINARYTVLQLSLIHTLPDKAGAAEKNCGGVPDGIRNGPADLHDLKRG